MAGGAGDDAARSDHQGDRGAAELGAGSGYRGGERAAHAADSPRDRESRDVCGNGPARRSPAAQADLGRDHRDLVRLRRDIYADFSVRHFYEQVTEKHQLKISYNWMRLMLQEAGVVEREPGRASTGAGASAG